MERSDENLMESYVGGDSSAFKLLFERYDTRIQWFFRRAGVSAEDAIELAQQTFLHVHRARTDFSSKYKFRGWIYTIALNLRRDFHRKKATRARHRVDTPPPNEQPDLEAEERRMLLHAALKEIPEKFRTVLELHYFEELSFKEVGQALGLTESNAKVRAHRGYKALKPILQQKGL